MGQTYECQGSHKLQFSSLKLDELFCVRMKVMKINSTNVKIPDLHAAVEVRAQLVVKVITGHMSCSQTDSQCNRSIAYCATKHSLECGEYKRTCMLRIASNIWGGGKGGRAGEQHRFSWVVEATASPVALPLSDSCCEEVHC